jgi:hypothetical protein
MDRNDLTDAIDKPTVTALAEIFASRSLRDGSLREMIVDVLAPRLAAVAASKTADDAAWWRWRFRTQGRWSRWIPLEADEVAPFRELQGDGIAEGRIELEPLYVAKVAALPSEDLLAATVSCSGKEITIACDDHDVKDRLMDFLTGTAPAPAKGPR